MAKKYLALGLVLILLMTVANTAFAAGVLTVVQETFVVLPYDGFYEGDIYAEVKNTGDKPLEFTGGLFELADKSGNIIASVDLEYSDCNPEVLEPGETGYLYYNLSVEDAKEQTYIADYSLAVLSTGRIGTGVIRFPSVAYFQAGTGEFASFYYVTAIVSNETDEIVHDFYAGFAVKDTDGKLLYVTSGTWASSGIMPHSQMEIRLRVDENVAQYWNDNDIAPAAVEVIVFKTFPL